MKSTDYCKSMKQLLVLCSALLIVIGFGWSNAEATEGGGGTYPNGVEGFMTGALPPPGFYYVNYLAHYSTHRLVDRKGDKVPLDFHVNGTANASRFLYQSDVDFLGGKLGAYAILTLMHLSADTGMGSSTKSGLGDFSFAPYVSWHFNKNFHMAAALDITAPTGQYDKNLVANLGRNYWTIQPLVAATYPTDNGLELSGKFMYDFNTENTATKYTSGQEFHFDYATGYHFGPWVAGASGYFYKQVSDDHGAGATLNDGNKGQVFAAGPAVMYNFKNGGFIELKYMKEMLVENKSEGDKFVCKFVIPF